MHVENDKYFNGSSQFKQSETDGPVQDEQEGSHGRQNKGEDND
jgi:hypothetical protein